MATKPRPANKSAVIRGFIAGMLEGEWQGGDRLTELDACDRFQVSRTPIREALIELDALGLIELRPRTGATVLPFGADELRDLYAVRAILEVEAARLAAPDFDPKLASKLDRDFQRIKEAGGVDPAWKIDRLLHQSIAEGSGNARLANEIDRYAHLVQTIREIVGAQATTTEIHMITVSDHLAIVEGLSAQDAQQAAGAMRRHLDQASESAVLSLEKLRADHRRRASSRKATTA